jgi:CheY-like chemotaxis protein
MLMPYSALIIDDEELTLRTISRGLRQDGFEVFTALTGEEGLKLFHEEKPDLILLDIVLPGIDGVEVLRQIKDSNPTAIVIMMSAYHLVERSVEAMKLGAFDYLIKPFHLEDMMTRCIAPPKFSPFAFAFAIPSSPNVAATISDASSPTIPPPSKCSKSPAKPPRPTAPPS